MEELVVQHLQSESGNVGAGDAWGHSCSHGGRDVGKSVLHAERLPTPQATEQADVGQDEAVVQQSPVPRSPLRHVQPAEVPNQRHRASEQPLPARAVHEVGLAPPGEKQQDEPRGKEVGEDEAGQHRG